jgi:hypothetical protein
VTLAFRLDKKDLYRRLSCVLTVGLFVACAQSSAIAPAHPVLAPSTAADGFLHQLVRPWPPDTGSFTLAVSSQISQRVSSYDNALLALYMLRRGQREQAASLLQALAALQREDGAIPFTFKWPQPEAANVYVRSGAVAWVGYAATEYLDSDRGGPARDAIVRLAHGVARYLLDRQVASEHDLRDGLVLGGEGSFQLEVIDGQIREHFTPGEVPWAATEHNVDAYFFLRDFGKLTGEARFTHAAERIASALLGRGVMSAAGQLAQGFAQSNLDQAYALDCASWGALLLLAASDTLRAETALANAEWRYAARDAVSGALGHRPYAHAKLIENAALATHFGSLRTRNWDDVEGIWPEGSAGVALANLRLGRPQRAREILRELEKVRKPNGGMPTFTAELPLDFDTLPSLAGTVWIELVRYELDRDARTETLWRRR